MLRNIYVTIDHEYVPFVVITICSFVTRDLQILRLLNVVIHEQESGNTANSILTRKRERNKKKTTSDLYFI